MKGHRLLRRNYGDGQRSWWPFVDAQRRRAWNHRVSSKMNAARWRSKHSPFSLEGETTQTPMLLRNTCGRVVVNSYSYLLDESTRSFPQAAPGERHQGTTAREGLSSSLSVPGLLELEHVMALQDPGAGIGGHSGFVWVRDDFGPCYQHPRVLLTQVQQFRLSLRRKPRRRDSPLRWTRRMKLRYPSAATLALTAFL